METTVKQDLAASDNEAREQIDTLYNENAVSNYPSGEVSDLSSWIRVLDETSGTYYYYNTVTSISTWEEPEGYSEYNNAKIEAELKLEVEQIRREEQIRINVIVIKMQCFARSVLARKLVQMKKAIKEQHKMSMEQSNIIQANSETVEALEQSRKFQTELTQPQEHDKSDKLKKISNIIETTKESSENGKLDMESKPLVDAETKKSRNDVDNVKVPSTETLEQKKNAQSEPRNSQEQFKYDQLQEIPNIDDITKVATEKRKVAIEQMSLGDSDSKILGTDHNHLQNVDDPEKIELLNSQENFSIKVNFNHESEHQIKLKESKHKMALRRYMNTFWQTSSVDQIVDYSWYPNTVLEPESEEVIDSAHENANCANLSNANSMPSIIRPKSVGSFAVHVITTTRKKRKNKRCFNKRKIISHVEEKAHSSKCNLLMKNRALTAKSQVHSREHSVLRPNSSSASIRPHSRSQIISCFRAPLSTRQTVHQKSKPYNATLRVKTRLKGTRKRKNKLKPLKYSKRKSATEDEKVRIKGRRLEESENEKLDSLNKAASAGLKTLFALVDTSGDGYVDFKEMQIAICHPNEEILEILASFPVIQSSLSDQNKVTYMFDALDVDESGQIREEAFIRVLQELVKETEQQKLQKEDFKRLFDMMDHNGDGALDIHELHNALRLNPRVMKMVKLSPVLRPLLRPSAFHKIKKLYLRYDTDGSGTLNWDEFLHICKIAFPRI